MFVMNVSNEKTIKALFDILNILVENKASRDTFLTAYYAVMEKINDVCGSDYLDERRMNHTAHRFFGDYECFKDGYNRDQYDLEVAVKNLYTTYMFG